MQRMHFFHQDGGRHPSYFIPGGHCIQLFSLPGMCDDTPMSCHDPPCIPQNGPEAMELKVEESNPKHYVSILFDSKHAGHTGSQAGMLIRTDS